jgi:hypothetical protein
MRARMAVNGPLPRPTPRGDTVLTDMDKSTVIRRRLEARSGGAGTREFIRVLRLLERVSPRESTEAVQATLEMGAAGYGALHVILEHWRETPKLRRKLAEIREPQPESHTRLRTSWRMKERTESASLNTDKTRTEEAKPT